MQQQLRQQQQLQQQQHPNSTSSKMVATEEQLQLAHLKRRQLQLQQQQNQVAQQIKNTFPFTQMLNTLHCPQIQLTHLAPPSREDSLNLTSAVWFSWGVLLNSGIGEGEQSDRPRLLLYNVPRSTAAGLNAAPRSLVPNAITPLVDLLPPSHPPSIFLSPSPSPGDATRTQKGGGERESIHLLPSPSLLLHPPSVSQTPGRETTYSDCKCSCSGAE